MSSTGNEDRGPTYREIHVVTRAVRVAAKTRRIVLRKKV